VKRALGVCYYPEHWDESLWPEDARRMAEAGLTWVRIGEFAWSRLEPSPGDLDFDWLDRAIETLGAAGLKVVLGTPTATPPRWMLTRTRHAGPSTPRAARAASARAGTTAFSHEGYLEESRRIVTLLADRYGGTPMSPPGRPTTNTAATTRRSPIPMPPRRFPRLARAALPVARGAEPGLGQCLLVDGICDFDEIELPNLTVTEPNPAHSWPSGAFPPTRWSLQPGSGRDHPQAVRRADPTTTWAA
jgi:beta-galactosidase